MELEWRRNRPGAGRNVYRLYNNWRKLAKVCQRKSYDWRVTLYPNHPAPITDLPTIFSTKDEAMAVAVAYVRLGDEYQPAKPLTY